MKIYIIGAVILSIIGSCKTDTNSGTDKDTTEESDKANAYFERVFEEEVADSPMLQTRLGIRKDYGKWDDMSNEADAEKLQKSKDRLSHIKDSINPEL